MATLDVHKSCRQSHLRHSEIVVTHDALFFERDNEICFPLSKDCIKYCDFLLKCHRETSSQNISQPSSSTKKIDLVSGTNVQYKFLSDCQINSM